MASEGEYGHELLVGMEMSQASSAECFHFFGIIMQKYFATFIIRFGEASQKFCGKKLLFGGGTTDSRVNELLG